MSADALDRVSRCSYRVTRTPSLFRTIFCLVVILLIYCIPWVRPGSLVKLVKLVKLVAFTGI